MPKYGDVREDGYIFRRTRRGYEEWLSPEGFARHRQRCKEYGKHSCRGGDANKNGKASELLVRAFFLVKGWEVTVPDSPGAVHDMHVELPSVGWKGVQCRTARINTKTGTWSCPRWREIRSPIIALVNPGTKEIRFLRGIEPLPVELQ